MFKKILLRSYTKITKILFLLNFQCIWRPMKNQRKVPSLFKQIRFQNLSVEQQTICRFLLYQLIILYSRRIILLPLKQYSTSDLLPTLMK